MLTPNAWAIWIMFWPSVPATRWYRSVYAVLSDSADAVTTLTPLACASPASLPTSYQLPALAVAGWVRLAYVIGSETGGIHSGEWPSSVLVLTLIPCLRASAST